MRAFRQGCQLAAILPPPPLDFEDALVQVARAGFAYVEIAAAIDRPSTHREALADSGLIVSSGVLGCIDRDAALDSAATTHRRAALESLKTQVADLAILGATHAWMPPGDDGSDVGLARFGEACQLLADFAGQRMVKLCVGHAPGSALPNAGLALSWLERCHHSNLGLALGVRHCEAGNEDVSGLIQRAGKQLGHVHAGADIDPSNTSSAARWKTILATMNASGYAGTLAVQDSIESLSGQREFFERLLRQVKEERPVG